MDCDEIWDISICSVWDKEMKGAGYGLKEHFTCSLNIFAPQHSEVVK